MEEPTEPKRYTDMTEGERIEAADKAAVSEWLEEQTKGIPLKRKKRKIESSIRGLEELLKRLERWEVKE
ncbi:hypothetical protein ES703_96967 [subsurface metagenome]